MTTLLSTDNLKSIFKNSHSDEFIAATAARLNEILPEFQITTKRRLAAFIAQCCHESAEFTRTSENLNYSAQGLANTWPRRFAGNHGLPNALAQSIQKKPAQIANIVYASRMGNGDAASGDGWKFKGRGLIQITGRDAYARVGALIGVDLIISPGLAEEPETAIRTACGYWSLNGLNQYADQGDITKLTKIINGGFNGLAERQEYYNRALAVLS